MKCPYCGSKMRYMKTDQIQLGKTGFVLGTLSNLLSGAIRVHIFLCPTCGKFEFFMPQKKLGAIIQARDNMPLKICPECFFEHDSDDRDCPNCGHKYPYEDF